MGRQKEPWVGSQKTWAPVQALSVTDGVALAESFSNLGPHLSPMETRAWTSVVLPDLQWRPLDAAGLAWLSGRRAPGIGGGASRDSEILPTRATWLPRGCVIVLGKANPRVKHCPFYLEIWERVLK